MPGQTFGYRLSERLVVQSITDATDAVGGKTETVATLDTIHAELVPMSADERFQAQAVGAQTSYRFRVRVRSDLTVKRRVTWTPQWPRDAATVSLEVHGVLYEPDRMYQILECGVFS